MLAQRETALLEFIKNNNECSSKDIHDGINSSVSYATVKRIITRLTNENLLITTGKGKGTKYSLSPVYELFQPVDIEGYYKNEVDQRKIKKNFNFSLIQDTLRNVTLFTESEEKKLTSLQTAYKNNILQLNRSEYTKELERLAIDLSWKSSQIEGNTYTLLETERLLKQKMTASGKTKEEAIMLLNHKEAIDFIIENPKYLVPLTLPKIEDIHSLLTKELSIEKNIRKRRVGITGTNYRPLDNEFQIKEAVLSMCNLINKRKNIFEKAFLSLVLTSYIQPFTDGNKRTARIICNAILMYHKHCPISFRSVDSVEYKKALLLFYEQNAISPFKEMFINQFEFAVKTYF
ncbi:MAG: cell filamentation protein Fic [Bacteroidetes bacterium RIFCSPLOWO2_02_FULL_36_8]|nr:MAG: cell filamentation protein Fic [Bacteroidetes bacterium RIFCSPLOWO2_02_FULL_36_8]OFY69643.1 MAG: cell filamentation protein Fic [Bacteroidetes bacterium RIFCSPLOWO2_12_FULL_37_12]